MGDLHIRNVVLMIGGGENLGNPANYIYVEKKIFILCYYVYR